MNIPVKAEPRPFEQITTEVTSWPGVHAGIGSRGEFSFFVGRRTIGHLHGDRAAHFGFPKPLWRELHEAGRITHHPVFPGREGPAARSIADDDDVREVIELFRVAYEGVIERHGLPDDANGATNGSGPARASSAEQDAAPTTATPGPPTARFSEAELDYLTTGPPERLARLATVGAGGTPQVVPVGFRVDRERGVVEIRGYTLESTKKFRDVRRSGRAALVVDDLASVDPWQPRGVEVRGRAEALTEPKALIRIHPERIRSWGNLGA